MGDMDVFPGQNEWGYIDHTDNIYYLFSSLGEFFSVISSSGREPLFKVGATLPPFIPSALCQCWTIDHISWQLHSWSALSSWINIIRSGQFFTRSVSQFAPSHPILIYQAEAVLPGEECLHCRKFMDTFRAITCFWKSLRFFCSLAICPVTNIKCIVTLGFCFLCPTPDRHESGHYVLFLFFFSHFL